MKRVIKPLPLLLVVLTIIYFSLKATSGMPSKIPNVDKVGHFIAYFTLAFAIFLSLSSRISRIIFLILGVVLGLSLEFIQGQLSYRDMSILDGVANISGLIVGSLFFNIFIKQITFILDKLRLKSIFIDK